jgi:diketogulonate reductase-like aldo/keto reductase
MEAVLATGKTKSIGVSNVCLGASHTAVRQPLT